MAQARYLNIDLEGSFFVAEFAFVSENGESGWENDDSLAAGRNVKRMIRAEFSSCIKQDILILPQAGSILALIPDREVEEGYIKAGSQTVHSGNMAWIFGSVLETARHIWTK